MLEEYQMLKRTGIKSPQTSPNAGHSGSKNAKSNLVRMGVIGYGYWGPNIVRNFHGQEGSLVVAFCDGSPKALKRVQQSYPGMVTTAECREVLTAPEIDAVAIVTRVSSHYELAKAALESG